MDEQQPSAPTPKKPISPLVEQFRRRVAERPGYFGEQARRLLAEGQTAPQVITMYVRRGESSDPKIKTRTISLHPIPDKASIDDLLGIGFAIDGDTATLSVDQFTEVSSLEETLGEEAVAKQKKEGKPWFFVDSFAGYADHAPWSLAGALRDIQVALVEWLRRLGYEVKIA